MFSFKNDPCRAKTLLCSTHRPVFHGGNLTFDYVFDGFAKSAPRRRCAAVTRLEMHTSRSISQDPDRKGLTYVKAATLDRIYLIFS